MPTQIPAPDGSIAVFPDGMSDDAISAVMAKEYGAASQQNIPQMKQGPADLGFQADLVNQIPMAAKIAAATGATLQPLGMGGTTVNAPTWGERYQKTLANIRGGIEGYEASNPNGAYAAKAAGVVGPMLVGAGEVSPLVNALRGAAVGGIYGFSGTPDTSLSDDALATGEGAGLGLATAGAGHAVGSLAGNIAGRTTDAFTGIPQPKPQSLAAAMLTKSMDQQGVTPADLFSQLTSSAKPITAMDIGGQNAPLQRLGRTMVTLPGPQSQDITDFLNSRQEDQRGRVLGDISSLAPNTDTYGTAADLKDDRFQGSNPLYKQAFDNPIVPSQHLDYLQSSPDIQQGMQRGLKIQQRKAFANNVPFDPAQYGITGFNDAGDPIVGPNPSWRTWHAAREGLDDAVYEQADPLTGALPKTKEIASLQQLRSGLNNTLTTLNPDLAAADAAWSLPSQNLDAMALGQKFMSADPEQIDMVRSGLNPDADSHYQIGAGRQMRNVANDTTDNRNIPMRLTGDQTARDQLASAFGQGPASDFSNNMDLENQLGQTRQFVTGGSNTANKGADIADAAHTGWVAPALKTAGVGAAGGFAGGGLHGALIGALGGTGLSIAKRVGSNVMENLFNNEPRNIELAKALTVTGPQGAQDISTLLAPNMQRAATIARGKSVGSLIGRGAGSALLPLLMSPAANAGP